MSLPFSEITVQPDPPVQRVITEEMNEKLTLDTAIVRTLFGELREEWDELDKFRNYYDGEQGLVYGTDKFQELFPSFDGFEDNWCGPVIDAMADKIKLLGVSIDSEDEEDEGDKEGTSDLAQQIWNVFRDNDIDEQQADLTEGVFVEGRAAVIVWRDEELGARIDWNPAKLVKVRYAEDDYRKIDVAIKRWEGPSGRVYVNVYDENEVRKYEETGRLSTTETKPPGVTGTVPERSPSMGLGFRFVEGEQWPLPHDFGEVPVVEFPNKRGSELSDVIPLQDAINYLLVSTFVAAEFDALRQRVFFTHLKEPEGGWKNTPGQVWHLSPHLDADGRATHGQADEFSGADLGAYRQIIEMVLQHLALTSKTPVRMFFKSDRGGRGDAPSGESQLIEDEPLLDKVEDRMTRLGNKWFHVVRLVAKAIEVDAPIRGEMIWLDPRSKYRSNLLDEAIKMMELGLPLSWIVKKLGLQPEELAELQSALEEKEREEEQEKEEEFNRQLEMRNAASSQDSGGGSGDQE